MITKPAIKTFGFWLSESPSKNYLFHLLHHDIRSCSPSRSLDAGAGELRNYWMFPGHYVGISHNRPAYARGLVRGFNPNIVREKGPPEVYLMRLERDFSFLGLFDLCVCTQTIAYMDNPIDVAGRLADRVKAGGTLILDDIIEREGQYRAALADKFDDIEVIYWGRSGSDIYFKNMPKLANMPVPDDFRDLYELETSAPNEPAGHSRLYLRARRKKESCLNENPSPEVIMEGGLRIVKDDIPYLKMTD